MTVASCEVPVTALVVTYQSALTVVAMLESLRESHDQGLLQCVVVDNVSMDDTADLLDRHAG